MTDKKKRSFPTSFTVLYIVLVLAIILTYVVPAGKFSRLKYEGTTKEFIITSHSGETLAKPATQEVLDELNIKLTLDKFESGDIQKPVAIPGSYIQIEQHPQSVLELVRAPIQGFNESVDIMIFVLILGGVIGVLNKMGAFEAGMAALSRKTKGKEFLLIVIVFTLVTIGGTTYGMAEETIAFYPILLPLFLVAGFDVITAIASISLGASIGTMYSTVNAFSVVIASQAAGISFDQGLKIRLITLIMAYFITLAYLYWYSQRVKRDPTKSVVYGQEEEISAKFLKDYNPDAEINFTWRISLSLLAFALAFPVMVWGVSKGGWWFNEMSALFLAVGLFVIIISGIGEKVAVGSFMKGAADLVGVVLIIGLARSINTVMNNGFISDTLLYYCTQIVEGMNKGLFGIVQMGLFSILGFFIPSSSGLATLSMPIMAPLADTVGLSRSVVVSAYNWGQGFMAFITPTGLVLVTLELVGVTYDKWVKFVLPIMAMMGVLSTIMIVISTML
ncbi:YfcC family protein [Oceanivirga salmonicida]|uniref:YfcC family protein n=1 Tax=Oceanivirga salmonicida TaxID=1769291 RepID=UPI0012E232D7|nr:YfcC family protein [Oceanivirga salmonicida]